MEFYKRETQDRFNDFYQQMEGMECKLIKKIGSPKKDDMFSTTRPKEQVDQHSLDVREIGRRLVFGEHPLNENLATTDDAELLLQSHQDLRV